jgi:hypothetical protein
MMFLRVLAFLLVGRLAVFVLQKFPFRKTFIGKHFREGKFLEQLFSCDLCLGVWCFAFMGYFLRIDFVSELFGVYVMVFNEIVTGVIASFLMHIFAIGWNTKFGVIEVK